MATQKDVRLLLPPSGLVQPSRFTNMLPALVELAGSMRDKPVALVGHTVEDCDASATKFALRLLFPHAILAFQDHPGAFAHRFLRRLGLLKDDNISNLTFITDLPSELPVILCDGRSSYRFRFVNGREILAIIDHHNDESGDYNASVELVSPNGPAAAALAYEVLQFTHTLVDAKTAFALQVGILGDCWMHADRMAEVALMLKNLEQISGVPRAEALSYATPKLNEAQQVAVKLALMRRKDITFPMDRGLSIHCSVTFSIDESLAPHVADRIVYGSYPEITITQPYRRATDAFIDGSVTEPSRLYVPDEAISQIAIVFAYATNMFDLSSETRASVRVNGDLTERGYSAHEIAVILGTMMGRSGGGNNKLAGASAPIDLKDALPLGELAIRQYLESKR